MPLLRLVCIHPINLVASSHLASTSITVVVDVDIDGIVKISTVLLGLFLSQGISSNNYHFVSLQLEHRYSRQSVRAYPQMPGQC